MDKLKTVIQAYNDSVKKDKSVVRTFSYHYNMNKKYSLLLGKELVCEFEDNAPEFAIAEVLKAQARFEELGVPL